MVSEKDSNNRLQTRSKFIMQDISSLIDKHFPYPNYNAGQKECIEKAINAFLKGKTHVVMQAPTGIGKSVIATTIHRVLAELSKTRYVTTIITATKGLQDQYEDEDREIVSLKGRTNYPCPLNQGYYKAPMCKQTIAEKNCTPKTMCPYVKQRTTWCEQSTLRLTNTSFQVVAPAELCMLPENRANMIIIDECHDLDEQLIKHSTFTIDVNQLKFIKSHTSEVFVGHFSAFINYFLELSEHGPFVVQDDIERESIEFKKLLDNEIVGLSQQIDKEPPNKNTLVAVREEIEEYAAQLGLFTGHGGEWLITEYEFGTKIELKPVYAHQVAEYGIFRKSDTFLHMSATICGFKEYMFTLGLEPSETEIIEVPNPIPVENRPVYMLSKLKVSGDFDRGRLASIVDSCIRRHHPKGENGIIHTVSFQLAKDLVEYSAYGDKMVISNDREEILELLSKKNSGVILLSPSVEKGYDFKDDMSRYQIIPKVPYHYLGDKWVELNMRRSSEWYSRKAILRIVQASGRSVRGVKDYASTYIIDSNFDRLLKFNKSLFPSWYLDSLVDKS